MIRKLTLIHLPIVLELEHGEKLPYTTLVPMYSYELENEVIVCDKPELPNYPIIKPCTISMDHLYFSYDRCHSIYIGHYVHYVMYGKVMYPNAN